MKSILVTDHVDDILLKELESEGFQVRYLPEITRQNCLDAIANYQGLIFNTRTEINAGLLERGRHLEFVARLGSGLDNVDLDEATKRGVEVISVPEANASAVAEHALGMLLSIRCKLQVARDELQEHRWSREACRGFELAGKSIGIIGFGHTGSAFASKLSGLGMDVIAYDKYKRHFTADHSYVREVDFEYIFHCDIISLHVPLTAETRHLVDTDFLSRCRKGTILINTSRGAIVRTSDLLEAVEKEHLAGACLDVLENEKPETYTPRERKLFDRLLRLQNVVVTPHVAGWTQESKRRIAEAILFKIKRFYQQMGA